MPVKPLLPLIIALLPVMAGSAAAVPVAGSPLSAAAAAAQVERYTQLSAGTPRVAVLAAQPAGSEQVWYLRSALNVAALMCSDRNIVQSYNNMLRTQARPLDLAWMQERQRYFRNHGAQWQTVQDRAQTRLYNQFANTGQRARFCSEAANILAEARMVPNTVFANFVAHAGPRLGGVTANPVLAAR